MKAIVTIKLPRNPNHDPRNKQTGVCPINRKLCTDVTGEHHSYIETGEDYVVILNRARARAVGIYHGQGNADCKQGNAHITRVEVVEE